MERYQGLWYDVARFPKFFDRTTPWQTAEYTLKNDEKGKYVEVYNTAYNKDGSVKKDIFGKARIVNPEEPAALYVSFSVIQIRQIISSMKQIMTEVVYICSHVKDR